MTAIVVSQMSFDNGAFGPNDVQESTTSSGDASIGAALSFTKSITIGGKTSLGGGVQATFLFGADDTDYVWPERGFWRVTVEALEEGDL